VHPKHARPACPASGAGPTRSITNGTRGGLPRALSVTRATNCPASAGPLWGRARGFPDVALYTVGEPRAGGSIRSLHPTPPGRPEIPSPKSHVVTSAASRQRRTHVYDCGCSTSVIDTLSLESRAWGVEASTMGSIAGSTSTSTSGPCRVDLRRPFDYCRGRIPGCGDAVPLGRFVAGEEIGQGRNFAEGLRASR
jgi:hypothetical protein